MSSLRLTKTASTCTSWMRYGTITPSTSLTRKTALATGKRALHGTIRHSNNCYCCCHNDCNVSCVTQSRSFSSSLEDVAKGNADKSTTTITTASQPADTADDASTTTPTTTADATESSSSSSTFDIPGTRKGQRILAVVFTCTVCDTRSMKQFTERAYTHGVVMVRCPKCQNNHLIADRLGYFGDDNWDIEKQQDARRLTCTEDGVFEMTLEEFVGKDKVKEIMGQQQEEDVSKKDSS